MSPGPSQINVDVGALICPRHQTDLWRVFEGKLPNSVALPILLVQDLVARPEIQAAAGGEAAQLTGVIAEFGPGCCYVGETRWLELVREAAEVGTSAADRPCARCPHSYAEQVPYDGRRVLSRCQRCSCRGFYPRSRPGAAPPADHPDGGRRGD